MNDEFDERLLQVITPVFPSGARIIGIPRQSELVFAISWRLPHDTARRSKTIRLVISDEIVDLYRLSAIDEQRITESRIQTAILNMLAEFDPEREATEEAMAEIVQWDLTFGD